MIVDLNCMICNAKVGTRELKEGERFNGCSGLICSTHTPEEVNNFLNPESN